MSPPLIVGNVRFAYAGCGLNALSGLQNQYIAGSA